MPAHAGPVDLYGGDDRGYTDYSALEPESSVA